MCHMIGYAWLASVSWHKNPFCKLKHRHYASNSPFPTHMYTHTYTRNFYLRFKEAMEQVLHRKGTTVCSRKREVWAEWMHHWAAFSRVSLPETSEFNIVIVGHVPSWASCCHSEIGFLAAGGPLPLFFLRINLSLSKQSKNCVSDGN